jgi:hypothetical protein
MGNIDAGDLLVMESRVVSLCNSADVCLRSMRACEKKRVWSASKNFTKILDHMAGFFGRVVDKEMKKESLGG